MSNFESSVKVIPYSQERVYNKLSDLSNLEAVKDRLPKDKVQDLSFDSDTLSFPYWTIDFANCRARSL